MSKNKHKGLLEFSGDESGNLALGQLGFEEITATNSAGTSGDKSGKDYYVAIKAIGATASVAIDSEIVFTAECLQGSDLTATVMYPGDIIWGCFNYINITTNGSSLMKLLAYVGKEE